MVTGFTVSTMDIHLFWCRLPGLPRKMKWPVKVKEWHDDKALVYCRSDDAFFSITRDHMVSFPGPFETLQNIGIDSLKKKKTTLKAFKEDIDWALAEVLNANQQSEESCSDDTNDTNVDDIEMQGSRTIGCDDGGQELQDNKSVDDNNCDSEQKDNSDDGCTNTFVVESCSGDYDINDCHMEIQSNNFSGNIQHQGYKSVENDNCEIKQNEESCSDDSNDGNDDDIEIQDNTFVDGNDGDMEIQNNKYVDSDNGESDFSYDDDKDEDYVLPSDIDSDEEFCPAPDMSKYLKKLVETKILFENVNESADCLGCCSVPDIQKKTATAKNMYKRVTESADSLDSNCYVQGIGNDATVPLENVSDLKLKRLDEDKIIRDVNLRKIYMRKHMKLSGKQSQQMRKKTTERIYNNYHCCFYCSRFVQYISTHMKTHRNIDAVRNIMKMTNPDFSTIRKLGDDKNNQKVVEMKEGEFLIARRPKNNYLDVQQYGPCPHCRKWLQLNGLKKHIHQCLKGSSEDEIKESVGNCVLKSQVMAGFISSKTSKVMREEVLPAMKRDTVRHVVINDKLILMLGESWLRRNVDNVEKRKYYASQHMRLVAKMLLELRKMKEYEEGNVTEQNNDDTETALWEFLKPGCFDKIVDASLQVSLPDMDDMSELKAPSNAIKLKYDLKRLVNMKYAFLMKTNQEGREVSDCKSFLELMNLEWSERVTKIARTILQKRKYIESKDLPSPDDIEKLTKYLVSQLESMELIPDNYMKINALCQTRLMMYNKRRSGELEVISLQSYAARRKDLSDIDESVAADLTKVETYLLKSQELMTVRGKGGRPVPVIVPQDVKGPLDFIASKMTRKAAGISESNKYLFPNTALKYIRAYDSLKIACDSCQLKSPQRITSVAMRKYTATLSQLMNLDKYQMDWLCRHLGHTKPVHREAYRQMSGLIERVYVTKLMMVQDLNLTGQFKGQSLEDIDLTDIVYGADEQQEGRRVDETLDSVDGIHEDSDCTQDKQSGKRNFSAISSDEEEDKVHAPEKKKRKKMTARQRWTDTEVEELRTYFKTYLDSGITPRAPACLKAKKMSQEKGGEIWRRANHLIIKKISNINHK
ncbi:uncharacterized protein LOC132754246 isoform X5 [Ruditapes philippinarum]|uniref:uncharacterized protein LOC132754246 isoform X5 n=1 Tax=Ruditapes philippinarum TaxID=129788 RepID=UPI00295B8C08|nr:uncharacterized protein LOC132754246 isoform X5 [Ruditapes philippinarum]